GPIALYLINLGIQIVLLACTGTTDQPFDLTG
ncbi:MAG: hypothetical protein ACJAV7_000579, partial [Flavobacteriales bacterium]